VTAAQCIELRARLAEHAVSTLPERERREVERHLEWCAGCRKESRELQDGAAIAGLSLHPVDPPSQLEDRVVSAIRNGARRAPGPRRRMALRSITVIAAVIGLLGIALSGVLFARQQSTQSALNNSKRESQLVLDRTKRLLTELQSQGPQSKIEQLVMRPVGGSHGVGSALMDIPKSSRFPAELQLLVAGLDPSHVPYRVWLLTPHGKRLVIPGYIALDQTGSGDLSWFGRTLSRYSTIEIRDATGKRVLTGAFRS
jgi:putative zinc finger protein